MSSLIGHAGERWPLARAIDALSDAARQSGRPGLVWLVGLFYPSAGVGLSILLGFSFGEEAGGFGDVGHSVAATILAALASFACLSLFVLPLFRLVAGLARVSPPEIWREAREGRRVPRLRALWRGGAGMTASVFALWCFLVVAVGVTSLALLWPIEAATRPFLSGFEAQGPGSFVVAALLVGPLVAIGATYVLALFALVQLALHSLAHNRRGIGSALLHAWRILRHDVAASVRAIVVDVLLTVAIVCVSTLVGGLLPGDWMDWIVGTLLLGFAGVTRAAYWARAYRALGGLSPDDGVPGLT